MEVEPRTCSYHRNRIELGGLYLEPLNEMLMNGPRSLEFPLKM
jgi:hypothetical protein